MRVLLLEDADRNAYEVQEIFDMGFEPDIENTGICGLYLVTMAGEYLYIQHLTESVCNACCLEMLSTGYSDLTRYGEYIQFDPMDE